MRIAKGIALFACVLALLAAGCGGRRPLNVESPVLSSKGAPLTEEEVFRAIIRAAAITNWLITERNPGHLVAERTHGSHVAKVDIRYSPQRYSISLAETTMTDKPTTIGGGAGMVSGQQPGGGSGQDVTPTTVHRVYNRWVQELDKTIRAQLVTIGL